MSTKTDKQIGDLIHISRGQHKGEDGVLRDRSQRGWLIELATGEKLDLMFTFVRLQARKGTFEDTDPWKSILAGEVAEDQNAPITEPEIDGSSEIAQDAPESPCTAYETAGAEIIAPGEDIAQSPTSAAGNGGVEDSIANMTILQLRDLAKQKGVSIARTKADFLIIIKEKKLDEDLERLKGKVLFDRISELRISRLRSKEDLQKLLSS